MSSAEEDRQGGDSQGSPRFITDSAQSWAAEGSFLLNLSPFFFFFQFHPHHTLKSEESCQYIKMKDASECPLWMSWI